MAYKAEHRAEKYVIRDSSLTLGVHRIRRWADALRTARRVERVPSVTNHTYLVEMPTITTQWLPKLSAYGG